MNRVLIFCLILLSQSAYALDWDNSGSTVAVPSGQTLNATGTGEITATSIDGTASDGSRFIDLEQNTVTPSAPADDYTRLYCDKDFITTNIDACFEHTNGTASPGARTITENPDEGMFVTLMGTPPSTAAPSGYTRIYAKSIDSKLYHHPNGGSEEEICSGTCSVDGYYSFGAGSLGTGSDYFMNWRAISSDGGHVQTGATTQNTILPISITVTDLSCAIESVFNATSGNGRRVTLQKNSTSTSTGNTSCFIDFTDGTTTADDAGGCSVSYAVGDTIRLWWNESGAASGRDVSCAILYTVP